MPVIQIFQENNSERFIEARYNVLEIILIHQADFQLTDWKKDFLSVLYY